MNINFNYILYIVNLIFIKMIYYYNCIVRIIDTLSIVITSLLKSANVIIMIEIYTN